MAHAVWIDESEYPLLAQPNVTTVLNPQCNAKLASGVPPVAAYRKNNIRYTMGTDGAASNNNQDIFAEMSFLTKLHHVIEGNLKGLPGPELFDSATIRAAEAFGLENKLGSLEAGKDADFIIIDTNTPHLTPLTHPYSHLIHSVQGSDVESVYVAGKCLMRKRKILVTDEKKVINRANKIWNKMKNSIKAVA